MNMRYRPNAVGAHICRDDVERESPAGGPAGVAPPPGVARGYPDDAFIRLMREGIALGGREIGLMSEVARGRFIHFTDAEIRALHAYLRTLDEAPHRETFLMMTPASWSATPLVATLAPIVAMTWPFYIPAAAAAQGDLTGTSAPLVETVAYTTLRPQSGVTTLIAELLGQLDGVEQKVLALADAFTEAEYEWRPGPGVRSGAEVFMHVAAINFVFPLFAGHEPPASTGLTLDNLYTAADAYQSSRSSKEDVRPELRASFENLRAAIESPATSDLDRPVSVFGNAGTVRLLWIAQLGHLQEHLGQLIAYARVNGIVPPWSQ